MSWWKNLFGRGAKDPERLYKQALELFGKEKFRDAATLLEETAGLNPNSAPVHFTLGTTYSRIAGEYGKDEEKIRPWMKKSRDSFKKAVDLAATSGGLNEKQLSTARDIVIAFDRITEKDSPSVTEDERRRIFADFMETHDTEFLLGTNIAQEFGAASRNPSGGLATMMQSLKRNAGQADAATYAKIGKKYSLSEGQLRAIVEEGKQKKWPFKGVDVYKKIPNEIESGTSLVEPKQRTAEDHTKLGNKYLFEDRNREEAIREYKEALRLDPNHALARSNLGSVYLQEDRIEEAIAEFEEALRRGISQTLIRHNTENWQKEAISIRDLRQKPIGGVDKAIQEYITELRGPCNRLQAVYEKLIEIGAPAVDALISAICTNNSVLSNRAFELLGEMGDPRAIEPLLRASKISEKEFRAMTGDKGPTRAVNRVGRTIEVKVSDYLEEYRQRAKQALDEIKRKNDSTERRRS